MKSIFPVFVLIIFFSVAANSQENFRVIKVNGTIVIRDKGTSLETGTVFTENEDLLFRSEDATAAVINPKRGRLILTNKSHDLASASSNYLPAMYNIATRGNSIPGTLSDLQNHFSGKYVVLDRQAMQIDDESFPMNNENFFFFRYAYKNQDINKKLEYNGDTLIIDREKLYSIDGQPIPGPDNSMIMLFYRKGSESVWISNFELIFPEMQQLKKEVRVILDEFSDKPYKDKVNEVNGFVNDIYGKVYRPNLTWWLGKNFGLKPL